MTTSAFDGLSILDADTHLTEPHDLWTSRAPSGYEDRVPQVQTVDGVPSWMLDGNNLGKAGASGVVYKDGRKVPGIEFFEWGIEDIHAAAYSVPERLAMMDELGIDVQIVYPNTVGFGGQLFGAVPDPDLKRMCVEIYNDAMAEIQAESGGRLFPMGIMPFWDLDLSIAEIERMKKLDLHGINMTSATHDHGLPDLGDPYWNPMWEVACDLNMPVNFHIGASASSMAWYGSVPWPSLSNEAKLGLGSAMMYINNAGVMGNIIYSGVLERYPTLQIVSVESGMGWIPFFLHALDYQVGEMGSGALDHLSMAPSEYARRQLHTCFWFETEGLDEAIKAIGWEHLMFETDFPHPTCTYPNGLDFAEAALTNIPDPTVRKGLMGGNAARLYGIDLPDRVSA